MSSVLPILGIILAVLSVLFATIGSSKASSLSPNYIKRIRSIKDALDAAFSGQEMLVKQLMKEIKPDEPITGSAVLCAAVQSASDGLKRGRDIIDADDDGLFSESEAAAKVRLWLVTSALLAMLSAICQLL